jgi:heat shock protein HtpX
MWEQIRSNQRRSAGLVVLMAALLLAVGYAFGAMLGAGQVGLLLAFGLWVVLTLVAYFQGDQIFLSMAGAREIKPGDFPKLFNIVEEMKIASGLPTLPKVFVIDDPSPNAFATGRSADQCVVAVTTGLLERLDRDELQGVIAHEIGHIKNRDILFMLMVGVMLGAIVMLADVAGRMLWHGRSVRRTGGRRSGGGAGGVAVLIGILLVILAPIFAQLIYFACSRRREYLADASAALFTRYPEGLACALEKISSASVPRMAQTNRVTAPMFIVNPMELGGAALAAAGLFSTHPPARERIRILRGMGGASLADYERTWRSAHGGKPLMKPATLQSSGKPLPIRERSATPPEEQRDRIGRAREVTDLLWKLERYAVISCTCGAKLKVPPGYKTEVACPRCRRRYGGGIDVDARNSDFK